MTRKNHHTSPKPDPEIGRLRSFIKKWTSIEGVIMVVAMAVYATWVGASVKNDWKSTKDALTAEIEARKKGYDTLSKNIRDLRRKTDRIYELLIRRRNDDR